jgi:hypothetical protein
MSKASDRYQIRYGVRLFVSLGTGKDGTVFETDECRHKRPLAGLRQLRPACGARPIEKLAASAACGSGIDALPVRTAEIHSTGAMWQVNGKKLETAAGIASNTISQRRRRVARGGAD